MLIFWLLNAAAYYFYVPLVIGWIVVSTASEGSRVQSVIGWALIVLGLWGAVTGIPHWWAVASKHWDDKQYMDQRCQLVMEKLPSHRPLADGVVIVYKNRNGHIPEVFDAMKLVHPGLGRFQRVQEVHPLTSGSSRITEIQWTPSRDTWLGHPIKSEIIEPSLAYELSVDSLTTDLDRSHGVEGIDLKVIERSTQAVLAHRVQYIQRKQNSSFRSGAGMRACPSPTPEEVAVCNTSWNCAIGWTLVLRALQPKTDLADSQIFHLHRGMAKPRLMKCSFPRTLLVGPGIKPADIEWWGEGLEGWEDLHLRIRGTQDELVCDMFFWGGNSDPSSLQFTDGSQLVLDRLAPKSKQRPAAVPQLLPGG